LSFTGGYYGKAPKEYPPAGGVFAVRHLWWLRYRSRRSAGTPFGENELARGLWAPGVGPLPPWQKSTTKKFYPTRSRKAPEIKGGGAGNLGSPKGGGPWGNLGSPTIEGLNVDAP